MEEEKQSKLMSPLIYYFLRIFFFIYNNLKTLLFLPCYPFLVLLAKKFLVKDIVKEKNAKTEIKEIFQFFQIFSLSGGTIGNPSEAINKLNRYLDILSEQKVGMEKERELVPGLLMSTITLGKLFKKNRVNEIIMLCQKTLALTQRGTIGIYYCLGYCYEQLKEIDKAIGYYNEYWQLYSNELPRIKKLKDLYFYEYNRRKIIKKLSKIRSAEKNI